MKRTLLMVAVALTACNADDGTFGAEDERFVETMVELRRAAVTVGADTTRFEQMRRAILEDRGVTEDELRAYVSAREGDLSHMASVWDSVAARLSELPPQ